MTTALRRTFRRTKGGHCGICNAGYRTWAAHAVSEGHQAKAYRVHNPTVVGPGHKRLERRAAARRARRVDQGPDRPIRVKAHGRHPPLDGPVKSVHVVKHRRGAPWVDVVAGMRRRWGLAA